MVTVIINHFNILNYNMTTTETKQVKKRQLSPEQIEKMRLGRIAKAKERKEKREKDKELTKQAIQQQKERIELLNITKKKKAEIKRRLAEVKKGSKPMEEVEEIINQYDPTGDEVHQLAPQGREAEEEEVEEVDTGEEGLRLEIEKYEEEQKEKEEEERKLLVEKVKNIKEAEQLKIKKLEEESNKFENEYKAVVNKILESLPNNAKKYFKMETDNFDPKLSVEVNIENMISNLNQKIENNIKTVENVKDTLEEIEIKKKPVGPRWGHVEHVQKGKESSEDLSLKLQKKIVKSKLEDLYKLR
jgi:uncharacterized protein (DUF2249 family)